MRQYLIMLFVGICTVACGNGTDTQLTNNSDKTQSSTSLVDKVVGTYSGKMKMQSSTQKEGVDAKIEITKESEKSIRVKCLNEGGSTFILILDESRSNAYAQTYRNEKGQKIASLMHITFSYNFPREDGDIENFSGSKE